jgi:hypothetical protein
MRITTFDHIGFPKSVAFEMVKSTLQSLKFYSNILILYLAFVAMMRRMLQVFF